MTIEKDKHYAIVVENGCGKSTVVKLLLRLYKVDSGAILIDDININSFTSSDLYSMITALFQDFSHYYVTIKENIGMGRIESIDKMDEIMEATHLVGIDKWIDSMTDKYDTILGKMNKDGIDISGGEWQKNCFARLLMSYSQLKILDEPTSSMDAIYENKLYQEYVQLMNNTTSIFISHSLSSTQLADIIYVIHDKTVKEVGTHKELIDAQGKYYEMFEAQKKLYIEGDNI